MFDNLNHMKHKFNKHYDFFPDSYVLPNQVSELKEQAFNNDEWQQYKFFISKPYTGRCGIGIKLIRNIKTYITEY